jgi:hypothetical protein
VQTQLTSAPAAPMFAGAFHLAVIVTLSEFGEVARLYISNQALTRSRPPDPFWTLCRIDRIYAN